MFLTLVSAGQHSVKLGGFQVTAFLSPPHVVMSSNIVCSHLCSAACVSLSLLHTHRHTHALPSPAVLLLPLLLLPSFFCPACNTSQIPLGACVLGLSCSDMEAHVSPHNSVSWQNTMRDTNYQGRSTKTMILHITFHLSLATEGAWATQPPGSAVPSAGPLVYWDPVPDWELLILDHRNSALTIINVLFDMEPVLCAHFRAVHQCIKPRAHVFFNALADANVITAVWVIYLCFLLIVLFTF